MVPAGFVSAVALVAGVLVAAPAPAAPVPAGPPLGGVQQTFQSKSSTPLSRITTVSAACPAGKVVVGGGGRVVRGALTTAPPVLTQLEPQNVVPTPDGPRNGYTVSGAVPAPEAGWRVEAYALCARPVTGRHLVLNATADPHQTTQKITATCPDGESVIGSGARINGGLGGVGLQVARPDILGGLVRAQAKELPAGAGNWNLVAVAVCAPTPDQFKVVFAGSGESGSEPVKDATASCIDGRRLIGTGGAVTDVAPAGIALTESRPVSTVSASTVAIETEQISDPWDTIVSAAICARAIP
jgi:hypothetical protein